MIPRGRPTLTPPQVAEALGVSLATYKRRFHKAFTAAVAPVDQAPPGGRPPQPYQYDEAQVAAYVEALRAADMDATKAARAPLPELPTGEHPDDLLTDKEAAAVLGVDPSTVRAYASTGYLDSEDRHGSFRVRRSVAEARRDAPDQRHRTTGSRNKAPRPDRDPRAVEVGDWLAAADQGERPAVTTAEIRRHFDVPDYTARRILARARNQDAADADQQ